MWCGFLGESAKICNPGSLGTIGTTFFDCERCRENYQYRSDRRINALKNDGLVDTDSRAVFDIHCSVH